VGEVKGMTLRAVPPGKARRDRHRGKNEDAR
jgi:hypothetical protein